MLVDDVLTDAGLLVQTSSSYSTCWRRSQTTPATHTHAHYTVYTHTHTPVYTHMHTRTLHCI